VKINDFIVLSLNSVHYSLTPEGVVRPVKKRHLAASLVDNGYVSVAEKIDIGDLLLKISLTITHSTIKYAGWGIYLFRISPPSTHLVYWMGYLSF